MNGENSLEKIAGTAILLLLVIGCFVVIRPFVSALLLALILSYSTWPVYAWVERIVSGRKSLPPALMTLAVASILLVPLIILGSSLAEQVAQVSVWIRHIFTESIRRPPSWVAAIPLVGPQLYEYWQGLGHNTAQLLSELANAETMSNVGGYLLPVGKWLLTGATILGQGALE